MRPLKAIIIFSGILLFSCKVQVEKDSAENIPQIIIAAVNDSIIQKNDTEIIGSFLGDEKRCYYGDNPPSTLSLIWKCWLGGGLSHMPYNESSTNMRYGAGWTGQPLLFRENNTLYLLQGSYDYNLRKINAQSGKVEWKYSFDNAIKGTGTLWKNKYAEREESKLVVLQGSRYSDKSEYNYRGISAISGEELFRMKVERTRSNSRDVDGSALIVGDTAYIGLENGIFKVFNPNDDYSSGNGKYYEPEIYNEVNLFNKNDIARVGGNIITESSPAFMNSKIYITAGSGYMYGYNIESGEIDWEYFIGADLNGSPVITEDSCILVSVEKQNISGNGGVLKLNPKKSPDEALVWYFPVGNRHLHSWDGGVIGSAAINDKYKSTNAISLAAFIGIDGYLYVVDYKSHNETTKSFDGKTSVDEPALIYKYKVGSSISTPIIFKDRLIACSYDGIFLFEFDENNNFNLIEKKYYVFEATPIVYDKKIYVASKDGWLYCFGDV